MQKLVFALVLFFIGASPLAFAQKVLQLTPLTAELYNKIQLKNAFQDIDFFMTCDLKLVRQGATETIGSENGGIQIGDHFFTNVLSFPTGAPGLHTLGGGSLTTSYLWVNFDVARPNNSLPFLYHSSQDKFYLDVDLSADGKHMQVSYGDYWEPTNYYVNIDQKCYFSNGSHKNFLAISAKYAQDETTHEETITTRETRVPTK
jgi:hypothetical protein